MALNWSDLTCTWAEGPQTPEFYLQGRDYRLADSPASKGAEAAEWPEQVYASLPRWAKGAADLRLQAWVVTEPGWAGPRLFSFTTGGASYYCTPAEVPAPKPAPPSAVRPPGGWIPWVIAGVAVAGLGISLATSRRKKKRS